MYLNKSAGENLNNIITAVGTAAVAPFPIVFNPISKEDKETRLYSAYRQPISAGLVLGFQVPVMMAYNNHLDRVATYAKTDRMDLSAKPCRSTLKPLIVREYRHQKALGNLSGDNFISKRDFIDEKLIKYQDKAFYRTLDNMRKTMGNEDIPIEKLINPDELAKAKKDVFYDVLKDHFNITKEELDSNKINNLKDLKKKGKKLLKSKDSSYNYKSVSKKIDEKGLSFAKETVEKTLEIDGKRKLHSSELRRELKKELSKITKKIDKTLSPEAKRAIIAKEEKKLIENAINELLEKEITAVGDEKKIFSSSIHKLRKCKGRLSKLKDHGSTPKEATQSVKIKKLLTTKINKSEVILRDYKTRSGIVIGLAILPAACTLLNWVYPRVMEKLFPELSKAKKAAFKEKYAPYKKEQEVK